MRIIFCILQDLNCSAPTEIECKGACYFGQLSNGIQIRGCSKGEKTQQQQNVAARMIADVADAAVAFAELNDHDKKCKKVRTTDLFKGTRMDGADVCVCNYDGCNTNTANPTSLASLMLDLIFSINFY